MKCIEFKAEVKAVWLDRSFHKSVVLTGMIINSRGVFCSIKGSNDLIPLHKLKIKVNSRFKGVG